MNSRKLAKIAITKKGAVQKINELSSLISLLKRRNLDTIVEIGTQKGGTLYLWCKIAGQNATIISIDLPHGPFGGGYKLRDLKRFRKYKRGRQKLYFLRKDSHKQTTKEGVIKILKGRKIDLLMVDGDHSYKGVKKDWQLYSPLVKQNGLIVFHDILYHPKFRECQVDNLWKEVKKNFKYIEFTDRKHDRGWGQWGGIGIIYYKR